MKVLFLIALLTSALARSAAITADPATTADEQRALVESLSGVAQLGVSGLPTLISQRFSDSPEIFTTAKFLKSKYADLGISAEILEYDPTDVLPYYAKNTNETYQAYLVHRAPELLAKYDALCSDSGTPESRITTLMSLKRVDLTKQQLCETPVDQRVALYTKSAVAKAIRSTGEMLHARELNTWPNVMAIISTAPAPNEAGGGQPRPLCVIGAHMDSIARAGDHGPVSSPKVLAPGADDNASGTAAVLTLARALHNWVAVDKPKLDCDLAFVHFSGEEEGLFGSLAFVHLQTKRKMLWMVNFDMIAYNPDAAGTMNVGYVSRFGRKMAEYFNSNEARLRTVIVEKNDFIYSSDQIAFWDVNVPAISISEQACAEEKCLDKFVKFNPNLHTSVDTVESLDFRYAALVIERSFDGIKALLTDKSN